MSTDVVSVVASWPGVVVESHGFGGRKFSLGDREFGHIHGESQVDSPFPKRIRDVVVEGGSTAKHHRYPKGWVTKYVERDEDAERAIWHLRVSYLSHVAAVQRRGVVDAVRDVDVASEVEAMDLPEALRDLLAPERSYRGESAPAGQ